MYEENKQHLELGEIGRERRTWRERERERERERGSWSRLENWRRLVEEACHCCLSLARARSSMVGPSTSLILAGFVCKEKTNTQDEEPYKIKPMGTVLSIPFSAFWLRSSVVSVLISLIFDTWINGPHDIKLIFLGWGPIKEASCWGSRASPQRCSTAMAWRTLYLKEVFWSLSKWIFYPSYFLLCSLYLPKLDFNPRLFCLYGNELSGQVPDSIGKLTKL